MADDGNISSALVAASQDLLDQARLLKNHVFSCLMVLHETRYTSQEDSENSTGENLTHFEWIVDPSQDENCYGSNNLV